LCNFQNFKTPSATLSPINDLLGTIYPRLRDIFNYTRGCGIGDLPGSNSAINPTMAGLDFLLHESSVGYAIFQVVHQADTIGNRLREVQQASLDLAKFGKMIKLVSFVPFQYAHS
jgi:NOP5NT (NUC127) domain